MTMSLFSLSTSSSSSSIPSPPQSSPSSKTKGKRIKYSDNKIDWISKLPDDLLQKILSTLPIRDAVRTSVLSTRWVDVWKIRPDLCLDLKHMNTSNPTEPVHIVSVGFTKSVTKTITNHRGRLESCTIHHYIPQCEDGTLELWTRTVTCVKKTKELTLENYHAFMGPYIGGYATLDMPPNTFSHRSLTSLSLAGYKLTRANAFNNCYNLKTLKLLYIIADFSLLSRVFAACPSLEVLVLEIISLNPSARLKIENKNLEVLQVFSPSSVDRMKVHATRLEILDIRCLLGCERVNFILDAPKLRFNRDYWNLAILPRVSYDISSLAQEKKRIWLELLSSEIFGMRRRGSLSVRVDVKNPKEVEILKEVLLLWSHEMIDLEIVFKNTEISREEGESAKVLDDEKPFPDANFRVNTVRIYNFNASHEEEFALVSRFVKQETVVGKLMIETSSFSPVKKLMTEEAVAKLMKLPKGNKDLTIECF